MSVINKMLRDLDRRQTDSTATQAQGQQTLRKGTQSLGTAALHDGLAHGGIVRWWGAALLVLLLTGAYGLWWVSRPNGQTVPAGSTGVAATAMAPTLEPSLVTPMTSEPAPAPAPAPLAEAVSEVHATSDPAPLPTSAATVRPVVRPSSVPKPNSSVKNDHLPQSVAAGVTPTPAQVTPEPAALPVLQQATTSTQLSAPAPAPAPASAMADATAGLQSQAAMEALARAQAQWVDGNQAGALQVVQEVIARLEKSPAIDTLALATAAREYVRMTTVQQRPADALAMLVRLESPLSKVADIWALRGNTAQRLGLHAQAVHAYLNALELQPGQARWLLAAAVSMAAQGQTVPAAELAEKARRAGFLPPDVATYLQQLGVALRKP